MSTEPISVALPDPSDREAMLDLVAAYAIHAVDEHERDFVEAHLDDDPRYREELGRYFAAAAALTIEAPVPASTWDAIVSRTGPSAGLGSAELIAEDGRVAEDDRVTEDDRVSEEGRVRPGPANVIALDAARAGRRSRVRVAFAAAAASAVIAVPVTLQFAGGATHSIAALASRAAKQSGTRTAALRSADGSELANAVVTADGRGYLQRDALPALPEGQSYQLWAITGATPVSAGVLGRDPSVVAFIVDAPTSAIAISVEPTSGSSQPTDTPIAVGSLV